MACTLASGDPCAIEEGKANGSWDTHCRDPLFAALQQHRHDFFRPCGAAVLRLRARGDGRRHADQTNALDCADTATRAVTANE
jgi:hypothetical protein